ncbi:MAG: efflux RND transporter periplasmic adaptor subunit [Armatimonadota bacterium]
MMINNWKRWAVLALAIILVVVVVAVIRFRQSANGKPTIRTAKVERGSVTSSVSANGVLQPLTTVDVKSNVGGSIVELAVDEGDLVKPGQLIAKIDPSDTLTALEQNQADMASAVAKVDSGRQSLEMQRQQNIAQLQSAEHAIAAAKARLVQAEEQARVQPGLTNSSIQQAEQALASAKARLAQAEETATLQPKLTSAAITQAESNLEEAKANYQQAKSTTSSQKFASAQAAFDQAKASCDFAKKDLVRQQALLDKGFVSRSVVEDAQQKCDITQAQLDSAKNKLDTIKDEVASDIKIAQARIEQATASLKTAQANSSQDRLKLQDLEAARAAVKQSEASLTQAQHNRVQDKLKQQDLIASRASLAQAEETLRSARASLYQNKIRADDIIQAQSQMTRARAAVDNARTQLGYTTITAPRAGVVIKKFVDAGSIIAAGKASSLGTGSGVTIVQIADTSRMFAQVNVDETDIAKIEVGQSVDISIDAYPNELFDGKVTKIAPQAVVDQNVTTVPVTIEVNAPDSRLKPTMNVTCDFITERHKDVLMVPNEAIKDSDNGPVVKMMENGTVIDRKVQIELVGNDYTEVTGGLKEGEEVITAIIESKKAGSSGSSSGNRGRMRMPMP